MSTEDDRRAPDAMRIPFDAMVEVGGSLGPSFEAQAVNLSEEGMHLRTAYLPDVGMPVMCRFDAGQGMIVVAAGEVTWREDMGDGGEFGIRFTNLDAPSLASLHRIIEMAGDGDLPPPPFGRKVRLHIEGLASPMRARVKHAEGANVTAYSELGFLQMGKKLELEDAMNGDRRPALIDRVAVEVSDESRIPQLVVTLRYDDEEARAAAAGSIDIAMPEIDEATGRDSTPNPHASDDDVHAPSAAPANAVTATDEDSMKLKSTFARSAAKVTPALTDFAKKAKIAIAKMAARAKTRAKAVELPLRRTTAPPPDGALHASGRKVIRGEIAEDKEFDAPEKRSFKITGKKAAIAGAVGATVLLAFVAMKKPAASPAEPPAPGSAAELAAAAGVRAAMPAPAQPAGPATPTSDPLMSAAAGMPAGGAFGNVSHGKTEPFGSKVGLAHANVLKLRMDGAVERFDPAEQPTGFSVLIPGRKALDTASALAAKDPRIAVHLATVPTGTELTVTFKDGVPNYQVRAKGDTLELLLAKAGGSAEKSADAKPSHGKHHKKHER